MPSANEIKKKLEQNWIQFLKTNSSKLSLESINGSSPPSLFVGRYGYPKVNIGPMIPPVHGNTTILDKTELWTGKSIEEIANFRLSLVRGTFRMNVHHINGGDNNSSSSGNTRLLENLQELAMARQPVESEATFDKKPLADLDLEKEIILNSEAAPFGPAAPVKTFKVSSIAVDDSIESVYYDTDQRAVDAILEMYNSGVPISSIQRVLSTGMIGQKKKRKLVPTRWSISATDDIISSKILKTNETNQTIDQFEVAQYSHLSNYYSIILVPEDSWSYEMVEMWFTKKGQIATGADHEDARGLDHYPSIAGAYFAARLAVAEHLASRRRKAAALVLREIHPEYFMPLGVWQIREGVREALKRSKQKFDNLNSALLFACSSLSVSWQEVAKISKLWQTRKSQTKITDFST